MASQPVAAPKATRFRLKRPQLAPFAPPVLLQLAIYLPVTLLLSLVLLQPVKGTVVGFQWAFRMHGFDENFVDDHPN